jgi:tRNA (guanine-N7-)-methyltransferase
VVDIGCGGGRFDLMMAKKYPETNFLGVDIRAPLVERGNKWGEYAGVVDNLHFAECNATVSMGKWLKSYADDCGSKVETVAIQFPDPHFKKRHHKRRVVQPALVRALAEGLTPGARVFLQSDVKDVSEDMRDKFERFGAHLFDIDASLHDVSAVDPKVLKSNAESAVANAAAAFQEDEKARLRREKAEKEGYPGRRKDAEKAEGEEKAEEKAKEAPEAEEEGEGWRSAWAAAGDREGWLDENPLGVPTEREVQTNSTNGRCYRVMLVRNSTPV